ncbi:hypothetical protein A7981_07255 [Methylovorus sp. MM2]|nr:hypothetical protein A7981_07255 [Methylovorus sp. MM2]
MVNPVINLATHYLSCLKIIFAKATSEWFAHRVNSKGAALAFYTLFSLTPILVLIIAVMGYFLGEKAAHGELIEQISGLVGESGAHVIQSLLVASSNPKSGIIATLVSGSLIFIGATTVIAELKASLDEIWEVKKIVHKGKQAAFKHLLRTRILSFSIIIALAFLLLTSLALSAGLALAEPYLKDILGGYLIVLSWLSSLISFGVITAMFAVTYKMLPNVPLSWRDVAIGAALTAILFALGKFLIGIYLKHSAVSSSFGAAGSLIALLLWIYYSAQIFFYGAEVTRQFALNFGSLKKAPAKRRSVTASPQDSTP